MNPCPNCKSYYRAWSKCKQQLVAVARERNQLRNNMADLLAAYEKQRERGKYDLSENERLRKRVEELEST